MRATRVFDTCQDVRRTGQIAVSITAVDHCTQVVLLFDRRAFTIEDGTYNTVVGNSVAYAAGLCQQLFVVIVRADVHPVLVALRGQLVLQLDVVEVSEVHVEAVNLYWQEVVLTIGIVFRLGVYHPLVARQRDVHLTCRRHEVSRQLLCADTLQVVGVIE